QPDQPRHPVPQRCGNVWLADEPGPVDQGALSCAASRELARKAARLGDGPDRLPRQAHARRDLCTRSARRHAAQSHSGHRLAPRFTRTSALCDIYAPLRPGSDIAFLGGIINYILEHDLWFKEYALAFSNLSTIIDERFKDASELDGFFSGWDEESRSYKYDSWQYEGE